MKLSRLIQLHQITDRIIQLDTNDGDTGSIRKIATAGAVGATGLYGAGLASQMPGTGVLDKLKAAKFDISKIGTGGGARIGRTIAKGAGVAKGAGLGLLSKAKSLIPLSARHSKLIELRNSTDHLVHELNSNLLWDLPDDFQRSGQLYIRNESPGSFKIGKVESTRYAKPIHVGKATKPKPDPDGEGVTIYDEHSPSRLRRAKAVALAGGAYVAGRNHRAIKGAIKQGVSAVKGVVSH
jgi:hypothetical protein